MPTVRHPRALDDVAGHPAAAVTVRGESYPIEDGQVTLPTESDVRALADAHGVAVSALRVTETCEVVKSDGEVCGRERPCPYHDDEE
jgi:hypothetical protein